ncbi:MAG TPA: CorA family divalent cation transporter [Candidatus Paceibacterota bacterium]|nr:CorA family divalent cation transporter [Candidatus Paceibacterota bacterium]
MIFRHESNGTVWVDIEQPTPGEIRTIAREFSIGERIEAELLTPSPLPLVAGDAEHAMLVLHFPVHSEEGHLPKTQEVDFVVGRNFVLTVRYEVVAPLHRLRKVLETNGLMGDGPELKADVFLEILFAHLFASVRDHTNHTANRLTHVEREMFTGKEREAVLRISDINREFLHLSSAIANHEEPLIRFLQALERRNFFGPAFNERALRIRAENEQLVRLISTHRAVAVELRETNESLLSSNQNESMKTLTAITLLILPAELTIFIFDMSVPGTPLHSNPNAFWIVIGVIGVVVGTLAIIFARKHWF